MFLQVIVFTGGGTGGHVYPGIAVLQALRNAIGSPVRFVWIGSATGIERTIAEGLGLEYRAIATGKLRRYLDWKNVTDLFRIVMGYFQAKKHLRELRPVLVFSKGGFVSVPPVRAARALRIPVYSHESDFDPGLATRLNLSASAAVFCAYQESLAQFPADARQKVIVSGNPVRTEVFSGDPGWIRKTWSVPVDCPILLVSGGSLGARQVNELLAGALPLLAGKVFVIHQTGQQWAALPDTEWYVSRPFFPTEMPNLWAGADLFFGRSGAGTLWEAAASGVPLVLLPLGAGSRGDQVRNAELFAARGAAEIVANDADSAALAALLLGFLDDGQRRERARHALSAFDAQGAAGRIAESILARHSEVSRV